MANEFLKRTPTSSGNRSVFTFSAWVKKNVATSSSAQSLLSGGVNASDRGVIDFDSPGGDIRFGFNNSSSWSLTETTSLFRDPSSWKNVVVSVNLANADVSIYVNGIKQSISSVSWPSIVNNVFNAAGYGMYIGSTYGQISQMYNGQMFDVFWVDGQELKPDVFGYYKEGTGYISASERYATDFRPGQWRPHTPRRIKSEIKRSGGFGINGFYLPMNDSSNFGGDFHCDIDSIIKLKGEDLPQPKGGVNAPIESNLREDPLKEHLILAIPGASYEDSKNLIKNGSVDNGTTSSWTGFHAQVSVDNGRLEVNDTANAGGWSLAAQEIPTAVGEEYILSFDYTASSDSMYYGHYNGSYPSAGSVPSGYNGPVNTSGKYSYRFTATNTTSTILLAVNDAGTSFFEDIRVCRLEDPRDYHGDIKGVGGSNRNIAKNSGSGIVGDVSSYYGSSLVCTGESGTGFRFESADFAFGTDDFTVEGWFNVQRDTSGIRTLFDTRTSDNFSTGLFLGINTNDNLYTYGFPSGTTVVDMGVPAIDEWHHVVVERHGSIGRVYLDGVVIKHHEMGSTNYTDQGGTLLRPSNHFGNLYAFIGHAMDWRVYRGVAKYKGGFDCPKHYSPQNMGSWRETPDTCTNNFPTLNDLMPVTGTLSNGNLTYVDSTAAWHTMANTMAVTKGKWYVEMRIDVKGWIFLGASQIYGFSGINPTSQHIGAGPSSGVTGGKGVGIVYDPSDTRGDLTYNGTNSAYTGGTSGSAVGDVIGMSIDLENNNFKFYRNGELKYDLDGLLEIGAEYHIGISTYQSAGGTFNFGQNPTFSGSERVAETFKDDSGYGTFKYQPPTGHLAICSANMPEPSVSDPSEYFSALVWEGDGQMGRSISGLKFKPDLAWIKPRDIADNHVLTNVLSGPGKIMYCNQTYAEPSVTDNNRLALKQGGIDLSSWNNVNDPGDKFIGWFWKANGDNVVTNTEGTITSNVTVNQEAGFSIVTYTGNGNTGATFGHGLNKQPTFIMVKRRDGTSQWNVWTPSLTNNQAMYMNTTNQRQSSTTFWQDTTPNDSVITLGTDRNVNNATYLAYCWTDVEGYSKVGQYRGTSSDDGAFVYCGFKPAWVMIKAVNLDPSAWIMVDSFRNSINPIKNKLHADHFGAEDVSNPAGSTDATNWVDFLSNGFKLRKNNSWTNYSAYTYTFLAFAESPFTTANAK